MCIGLEPDLEQTVAERHDDRPYEQADEAVREQPAAGGRGGKPARR